MGLGTKSRDAAVIANSCHGPEAIGYRPPFLLPRQRREFVVEHRRRDHAVVEVRQVDLLVGRVDAVVGQADSEEHHGRLEDVGEVGRRLGAAWCPLGRETGAQFGQQGQGGAQAGEFALVMLALTLGLLKLAL